MATEVETVLLLHFNEESTEVYPSDRSGHVDDFVGDAGATPDLALPDVVQTTLGQGRLFADDRGMVAAGELVADATRLHRDVTIEAICELDLSAMQDADVGVIVQRGAGGSAAERILWGLQVERVSATVAAIRARWQEADGTEATIDAKSIRVPAGFLYIAVTRRWLSATEAELRYLVNDMPLGAVTVSEAAIGNGSGGALTVGCRKTGSDYADFFHGVIDTVRVSVGERSIEELRQAFRRYAIHQPEGYQQISRLVPPGVYSQDPESIIQRELMVEGGGIGMVAADGAARVEDGLPDRAHSQIDRWEAVTRQVPRPADRLGTRRNRVVGHLRQSHGFNRDALAKSLSAPLDCDAGAIEFFENSNLREDDFATEIASFWDDAYIGAGGHSIESGALRLAATGPAVWEDDTAIRLRQPMLGDPLDTEPFVGIDATVGLVAENLAAGSFGGMYMLDSISRELLIYGVRDDAGTNRLSYRVWDGTAWGAYVDLVEAPSLPHWLRIVNVGAGSYDLYRSATGPDDTATKTTIAAGAGPSSPSFAGVIALGDIGDSVDFDDWRVWLPRSLAVYEWFAYRDPADPGAPDYAGAERIAQRQKPAHTDGHAVAELSCKAGEPTSLCGITPLKAG